MDDDGSALLSKLLDEYGRPLVRYAGSGQLANDQESATVEWMAAQYDDGQVLLACQGDASTFGVVFDEGATRFEGTSRDGTKFASDGDMDLAILHHASSERPGTWAVYRLASLHAELATSGPPGLVRYLLTNFEFDRRGQQRTDLHLSGVEGVVRLVGDKRDPRVADRLRVLRGPRPTAWLEIVPQDGEAVTTQPIADHICYLLSVARGTKVAWIQEELLNTDGVRMHLNHSHRITKPFSPLGPIDPSRVGGIPEFLEMTYHVYVDRREQYRLDKGTIDGVLDAKVETDFLETRGAKLAVALESLKQNVLVHSHPGVDHYMPPEDFARIVPDLVEKSRAVLTSQGVASDTANAMIDKRRVLSLNRLAFGKLLGMVAGEVGLQLPGEEIKLFVQCRNSLVHRGDFYCNTASQEEREDVPPKASYVEEYFFMLAVVDAFLLRLVGYAGQYLVRTMGQEGGELRTLTVPQPDV